MYKFYYTLAILCFSFSNQLMAAATCVDERMTTEPFFYDTVCTGNGTSEFAQEYHGGGSGGGNITDIKRGSGHPIDPSVVIWTFSITDLYKDTMTITYTYGEHIYTYSLHINGTDYIYCNVGSGESYPIDAIVDGFGACPGSGYYSGTP